MEKRNSVMIIDLKIHEVISINFRKQPKTIETQNVIMILRKRKISTTLFAYLPGRKREFESS